MQHLNWYCGLLTYFHPFTLIPTCSASLFTASHYSRLSHTVHQVCIVSYSHRLNPVEWSTAVISGMNYI